MPTSVFSIPERVILEDALKPWKDAKSLQGNKSVTRARRRDIVQNLYDTIKVKRKITADSEKTAIWNSIRLWLANHGRREAALQGKKWAARWNWRTVINEVHRAKIREFISEHSSLLPGSEEYLSDYQKQFTKYIQTEVSKKDIKEARELAETWNDEKPPPDVQARNARLKAPAVIYRFLQELYRQYGMMAVVLSVHKDETDEVATITHDYTAEVGGKSLSKGFPNWKDEALECVEDFGKSFFGAKSKSRDVEQDDNGKVKLGQDALGRPILPPKPIDGLGSIGLKRVKAIILAYLKAWYCLAAGFSTAHPAWKTMRDHGMQEFVERGYLPKDFILDAPSMLQTAELRQLLKWFYDREEDPGCDVVFRWKKIVTGKGPTTSIKEAGDYSGTGPLPKKLPKSSSNDPNTNQQDEGEGPRSLTRNHQEDGEREILDGLDRAVQIEEELESTFDAPQSPPVTGSNAPQAVVAEPAQVVPASTGTRQTKKRPRLQVVVELHERDRSAEPVPAGTQQTKKGARPGPKRNSVGFLGPTPSTLNRLPEKRAIKKTKAPDGSRYRLLDIAGDRQERAPSPSPPSKRRRI